MKRFQTAAQIICDALQTPADAEMLEMLLSRASHAQAICNHDDHREALIDIKNFLKRARIIWETDETPTSIIGGVVKQP